MATSAERKYDALIFWGNHGLPADGGHILKEHEAKRPWRIWCTQSEKAGKASP